MTEFRMLAPLGAVVLLLAASARGQDGYHASTVQEGAARGMADMIRSAGAANLMNSEAAINLQTAQKGAIENRQLWTNTYFQMRETNKQYRYADRRAPTQEQLIRTSQSRLPDRLQPNQLDPLTGEIHWPLALRQDRFAARRELLQTLAARRAQMGVLSPDEYAQVRELTRQMTDDLRQVAGQFSGNVTVEARRFLESLAYEARFEAA